MEFWGVEVKPGQSLKVQPEFGKLIHISQAALGEVKEVKGAKYVPLRLKVDAKSLVLGALSAEERTQLMLDLVFERAFELSHAWKNGSVYFMGYIANDPVSEDEDFSDEFEDEPMDALLTGNVKQNLGDVKDAKTSVATKAGNKKEGLPVTDEDEDDSESDSDDEMAFIKSAQEDFSDDSEEDSEDVDGSFSSEEEPPKKAQQTKKRPADSAQKAPVLNKKAKLSTTNNTDIMPPRREFHKDIPRDIHEKRGASLPPPSPPPQDSVTRVLEGMAQLLERAQSAPRPQTDIYERFRRLDSREFSGSTDPFVAEGWIMSLEVHFRFLNMGDLDRVRCATYLLRDDALLWWEGAERGVDLNTFSWDQFKELFYGKYFTVDVRGGLRREFMSLCQGDMSVAEYIRKFDRGCHIVPLIANDTAEKLRHFIDGLKPTIRRDVMMMEPLDYAAATTRAFRAEQALKDIEFDVQRKRVQGQNFSQSNKRQFVGPPRVQGHQKPQGPRRQQGQFRPSQITAPNIGDKAPCRLCNRVHSGQCMQGTFRCFYCKEEGHKATNCPKKNQAIPARAYVMHAEEAVPDSTLITGIDQGLESGGLDH